MRRKSVVLFSTLAFLVLSVGTAIAYFSFTNTTPLGGFQTGSTQIEVTSQTSDSTDLKPGDTHSFEFSLANVGTLPVSIRGYFDSEWSDELLDTSQVKGVSLEVDTGSGFMTLLSDPFILADTFYFSSNGVDQDLWQLEPNTTWDVKVTVQLDQDAGTEYMLASYGVSSVLGIKEADNSVPWPLF